MRGANISNGSRKSDLFAVLALMGVVALERLGEPPSRKVSSLRSMKTARPKNETRGIAGFCVRASHHGLSISDSASVGLFHAACRENFNPVVWHFSVAIGSSTGLFSTNMDALAYAFDHVGLHLVYFLPPINRRLVVLGAQIPRFGDQIGARRRFASFGTG